MRKIVVSRDTPSKSAVNLAKELRCVRRRDKRGRVRSRTAIINWGCGSPTTDMTNRLVLNKPQYVKVCANKLNFFQTLTHKQSGLPIPDFTTSKSTAQSWLQEQGVKVVCRTLLTSHSGNGIVVATDSEQVVDAPLYTKYCSGLEYRVHCSSRGVFRVVQKRRRNGIERVEGQNLIKNLVNGWVFALGVSQQLPQQAKDDCVRILNLLQLDFCAFDVRYSPKSNEWFVLEGNTAPGLEGTTVADYADEIKHLLGE